MQDFRRENRFPAFFFSVFFISILLLSVYFFLCLSQSILKTCVYRIPVASVLFYIVKGLIRPRKVTPSSATAIPMDALTLTLLLSFS